MLNLEHIREILEHQLDQHAQNPSYMSEESKVSCEHMLAAINEGRVQIVAQVP